ncbi:dienelactone hydrolase family protein [Heyndrickxia sp. NPDC080065]|uniref:alpha/beta hydrolase n=1 Tax=Heyndrickxia sp. NPDC080065 TaxID=3390568 RepID=UPI003D080154
MRIGRMVKEVTNIKEDRKFMISIFYPVDIEWKTEHHPTFLDLFFPYIDEAVNIFKVMGAEESQLRSIKTNCYNDAPISKNVKNSPVIIYSPGIGVDRDMYLYNIKKLVHEGYIVITVGPTYDTLFTVFPSRGIVYQNEKVQNIAATDFTSLKSLMEIRINDITCLLDSLSDMFSKDRVDLHRIGVIGHSLGGATIFELAKNDKRIKAGIILDGSLHLLSHEKDVWTPFLSIRQHQSTYQQMREIWSEEVAQAYCEGQKLLYDRLTGNKLFVNVTDSDHMSFTDVPFIFSNNADKSVERIHHVVNELVVGFFDEFLAYKNSDFSHLVNDKSTDSRFSIIDREGKIEK